KNDTSYTVLDSDINTFKSSYCYSIQIKNKCDRTSFAGYAHCTILLQGMASSGPANILHWSSYLGWQPAFYRIFRATANGSFIKLDSVAGNILTYTDTALCDNSYSYFAEAVSGRQGINSRSNSIVLKTKYYR